MAAVSNILSSQQGPYEWGARDCLTTAGALIAGLLGDAHAVRYRERVAPWHGLSEAAAMVRIKQAFGGVGAAHEQGFKDFDGVDVLSCHRRPGDIARLAGWIEVAGAIWDTQSRGDLIGFVDDSCEILHWSPIGLLPVRGEVYLKRVFRCHK